MMSNENSSFKFSISIEYLAIETKTQENPGYLFSSMYA